MRLIRWFVRFIGWKTLFSMALLLIALTCVAQGLANVTRGVEFPFLFLLICLGMVLGWALASLPLPGWIAGVLGTLVGLEVVTFQVGNLEDDVLQVGAATFEFLGEVFQFIWNLVQILWQIVEAIWQFIPEREWDIIASAISWPALPQLDAVTTAVLSMWQNTLILLARGGNWLVDVVVGDPTFDPVGTVVIWGIVMWLIALWAGWTVARRYNTLQAILPAGALLSNVLSYTGEKTGILLPFLGVILILMAIIQHNAREKRWRKNGVDFSRDLWSDLLTAASGLALVLVIVSAIAPTITIEKVSDFVQELREDRDDEEAEKVAQSLGLEQQPVPRDVKPIEQMQSTGLPRSHLIGSGPELSRQIVLMIDTGELPPMQDDYMMPYTPPRYYWQSLAYDYYTGRGWHTSGTETIEYKAEEAAIEASDYITHHRIVHQRVRIVADIGNIIHTAGRVVSLDQPYSIAWRWPLEVQDAFGGTLEKEDINAYVADSLLSTAMAGDLRNVEAEYEPWIQDRYLQLPENTPARVLALARDLTAIEPTAYDRASAIETYLRTTFPYTLEVPYPPVDQDMADYFLFDLQKGYCDYYATSMTVLARAAGLPARMVIGYITGQYDIQNARYIITEADAHAWTEIYFPGYGWVKFEPTAGRPAIDRGTEEDSDLLDLEDIDREPRPPAPPQRPPIWPWILGGFSSVLGVFVVILGVTGVDALWLRLRAPGKTIKMVHTRMQRYARRLLVPTRTGDTAYEFNEAFSQRITNIAEDRPERSPFLLAAKDELTRLTELYVKQQYTPNPIDRDDQKSAIWTWWLVRWRLLLARLWRRTRRDNP